MKAETQNCVLSDGRVVRFRLDKRSGSTVYYVYFQGPNGHRLERSTKCSNAKAAANSAITLIQQTFCPETEDTRPVGIVRWADAKCRLRNAMEADNLRSGTISDYVDILLGLLERSFPSCKGPGEITSQMALDWKIKRSQEVSAESLRNDLIAMRSLYRKWLIRQCRIVSTNPFDSLTLPKLDTHDPKVLSASEQKEFLDWLSQRWNNWRLPILFLEVKGSVGCRISELAGLPTANLIDGRIKFDGDKVKGRADGHVSLPRCLYDELYRVAGSQYVFERYTEELNAIHKDRSTTRHAFVKPFCPKRMVRWLEKELDVYRKSKKITKGHPDYFKLHNIRGTAMTKAQDAGVSLDDASIFFRCHPDTIRRYYVSRDKLRVADDVARKIVDWNSKADENGDQGDDKRTAS